MAACLLKGICYTALAVFSSIEGQWPGDLWTIGGIVRGPSGYVIGYAPVLVENEVTGQRWETIGLSWGYFRVKVPPGRYCVSIQMWHEGVLLEGRREGLEVEPGRFTGADIVLRVANETVTVESSAASGAFSLTDGSVGVGFSRPAETTPLVNGQTFQALLALVPGVVVTESVGTLAQFTAAGQRRYTNRVMVDGISGDLAIDVTTPQLDEAGSGTLPASATSGSLQTLVPFSAINEIEIRTTNARAEHAHTPGAQTAIVTRAGGDAFKGSLFGQMRPRQLAAADYFRTISGQPRRFSSTESGATLGGPLRRGRLTFFAAAEAQRIDRPYAATVPVPSQELREMAPAAVQPILDTFPLPNGRALPGGLAEFSHSFPISSTLGVLSLRTDATLGAHRVFVRINAGASRGDAVRTPGQQPDFSFRHRESTDTRTATMGWAATSSAVVNDLRVNVSAHRGALVASTAPHGGAASLALSSLVAAGVAEPWVRITVVPGPSGSLSEGRTGGSSQQQIEIADTVTYVQGRHELRFGGDVTHVLASTPASTRYTYTLTPIAQLLQGRARLTIETREPARAVFRSLALFAQDAYRAMPRLTLHYGVRYSVNPAPTSGTDLEPALLRFDALPDVISRDSRGPLWPTSWGNIAPHVGAAYQLANEAGRETTLRAGWDLVFDDLTTPGGVAFGGPPYVSMRLFPPTALPFSPDALTASQPADDLVTRYAFDDLRRPRTYRWHVGADRALGRAQRVSVAYVGATARDLVYRFAYNPGGVGTVYAFSNDARSDYHALVTEYTRRLSRGLEGRVTWTWGHAIDIDSGESSAPNLPPALASPSGNRGSADFDRRHLLHAWASYRVPMLRKPSLLRWCLDGWQIDGVVTVRSGAPVTVEGSPTFTSYVIRPDLISDVPVWLDDPTSPSGRRLNRQAFTLPTELRHGTLGRNALRSSALRQVDLALSRSARLRSRFVAQIRVEAFNVLNLSNFSPVYGRFEPAEFGRPRESAADALGTGTLTEGGLVALQQLGGPRSLQIGVRVSW